MSQQRSATHSHVEAFCRMKYASDDGQTIEWIWNSRDGVTPFVVMGRDGKEMAHVEWGRDQYMPGYVPSVGERIFADLTEEAAREAAVRKVDAMWDKPLGDFPPMSTRYETQADAVEMYVKAWVEPGAPAVIEVTEEMHLRFKVTSFKNRIVIFDLDGTLALIEHRRPLVEGSKKDWRGFFAACVDDAPNLAVIEMARIFRRSNNHVVIFSGRSDEVKPQTLEWLSRYNVPYDLLLMRKAGDFTADETLKGDWLRLFNKEQILCVFDDRDKVVQMWREEGLSCFQVAPGAF